MRRHDLPWLALTALATAVGPGCGRADRSATDAATAPAKPRPAAYRLVGVVREVDPKQGVVTLRHEAIPGYMGAMTMPFTVRAGKDREVLPDLRPGDKVEAVLRVSGEDAELTDLDIAAFAEAPPMSVGASGVPKPRPAVLEPGKPVPDFAMTAQDGRTLRLSDLRGEVVALTFIYTRCPLPNFCPLMDAKFSELAAQLSVSPDRARRVRLLSVSFDPDHDTPEALARHARRRGARPPLWTFAVASHEELAKVAPSLGLNYGPAGEEVIHNLSTAVIAPDGTLARLERGGAWSPADLLGTIVRLLRPAPR